MGDSLQTTNCMIALLPASPDSLCRALIFHPFVVVSKKHESQRWWEDAVVPVGGPFR